MNHPLFASFLEHRSQLTVGYDEIDLPFTEADFERVLTDVVHRLGDNYPYGDPQYAGQMLKPPHQIAQLAYVLAMTINPNNHALDGGRASSAMEKEVVAEIASKLFGWKESLGHLTGGGTVANLEALWVSRELRPSGVVVASEMAHYTHERMSGVLGVPFRKIPCNAKGELDILALEKIAQAEEISVVVSTMGTTSIGSVDPLPQILELQKRFGFRVHADSAYGGYFSLASNLDPITRERYSALTNVDSIVIDPHKHGLQPYGCGCVLFRDPSVGRLYHHESPYTYFTSSELHLGEISLECSRPGAAAVALWATMQLFPLVAEDVFAKGLSRSISAARKLFELLQSDPSFFVSAPPALDIVVWGVHASNSRDRNARAQEIFDRCAERGLHLALTKLSPKLFPGISHTDDETITCLRSCLMKNRHLDHVDEIFRIVSEETRRA